LTSTPGTRTHIGLLVAATLAATILRSFWIDIADGAPRSDAKQYFAIAKHLALTGSYAFTGGPTAFWPVGYPAALGLLFRIFGASALVAGLFNVVLSVASLGCLYRVTDDALRALELENELPTPTRVGRRR
jgi:hypothetical protein